MESSLSVATELFKYPCRAHIFNVLPDKSVHHLKTVTAYSAPDTWGPFKIDRSIYVVAPQHGFYADACSGDLIVIAKLTYGDFPDVSPKLLEEARAAISYPMN